VYSYSVALGEFERLRIREDVHKYPPGVVVRGAKVASSLCLNIHIGSSYLGSGGISIL
jgi:hypothetical protein